MDIAHMAAMVWGMVAGVTLFLFILYIQGRKKG